MLRSKMTILGIALLLSMPTFALAWGGKGDAEPDTLIDRTAGFMQQGVPPAGPGGQEYVYFSAFAGTNAYLAGSTSFNTNFATVGSKIQGYPYQVYAFLGAWKDCNGDGFIGFGDNGLFEYRSELLVGPFNTGNCPVQPATAHNLPHNDGVWVHELLPIGWDTGASFENNPLNLNDSTSRVWGDWGLPGDPPSGQCYVRPWPYGSVHSPGGLLKHLDCFAGNRVSGAIQSVTDATGTTSTYNSIMATQPWGDEKDASDAQVWDCSQPQLVHQQVGTGATWVNVSQPGTNPNPNTGGSLAGTANATGAGLDRCNRRSDVNQGGTGGTLASAPYVPGTLESDVQDQVAIKFQTDQTLFYSEGSRPAAPFTLLGAVPGAKSTPGDGGTRATGSEGLWSGNSVTAASRNPYVSRQNLGLSPVTYTTYYATVGSGAVSAYNLKLPGSLGTYGSAACGAHATGIFNGWDCDRNDWYKDANGNDIQPRTAVLGRDQSQPTSAVCTASGTGSTSRGCISYAAFPGSPYNVRDIDCWDDSNSLLRPLGVSEEAIANAVTSVTNPGNPAQLCAYPTN